jgi:hypothetical protein
VPWHMPSDGVVAPEVREVESLAHDDVLGLSSVWTARSGLPPRDGDPLQERTSICDNARHILDALQPSLLRGRTAAMSNPAFAFDHIHIITQISHEISRIQNSSNMRESPASTGLASG